MCFKTFSLTLCVLLFVTWTSAQTKISGTVQCAKPEKSLSLEAGDVAHHVLMISQSKCTWTKPLEIAGTQTKEDVGTDFDEVSGSKSRGHGYVVGTLANGDKMYVHTEGSATIKGDITEGMEGTWSFTGGTGKVKGVKGKGTYTGKGASDGSSTIDVVGEYELPQ